MTGRQSKEKLIGICNCNIIKSAGFTNEYISILI